MSSFAKHKRQLRKDAQLEIAKFPGIYLLQSDREIYDRVTQTDVFKKANAVFCYVSVGSEVDSTQIIEKMFRLQKIVCVPRCLKDGEMEVRRIHSLEEVYPAPFGLLEPDERAPLVDKNKIDLAIIPSVSADLQCNRLGQGGGYYDHFLRDFDGFKMILCRHALFYSSLPQQSFDQPGDMVVTEQLSHRCGDDPYVKG